MTPARAVRLYTAAVFFFWMGVSAVFMAAGGLGLAGSAGLIGLMWLPLLAWPALETLRRPPEALLLAGAFIAWAAASLSWSPYDRPDQAIKLVLLTPLFLLVPFGVSRIDPRRRLRFAAFTTIAVGAAAAYLTVEALLGAPLAQWVKTADGAPAGPEARALAFRTLSRGASALLLITGPLAVWLWTRGRRAPACALMLAAAISASRFDVEANIAALALGAVAALAAWRSPRRALPGLFYAAAAVVLLTPFLMGALVALTPDELAHALPLSWHQRLEIWRYALAQLAEAPILGLGLDASRMLEDEAMLRGAVLHLVPLHPHNAGLHIWLETGALGAGLAAATLAAIGRRLARAPLEPALAASVGYCAAAWFVLTALGYGVWQEWHHGALSLALAASLFNAGRPERNLHSAPR